MTLRRRGALFIILVLLLAGALGLNAMAYMHAHAMTRFVASGERTERPEHLSWTQAASVLLTGVTVPRPRNGRSPADLGLTFETVTFASGHGPTLEAWIIPGDDSKPLVILLHGYAGSKTQLLPTAHALHELGLGTLLLDFYGSGGSSGSGTTLGVLEAQDVAAAVAYARTRWPGRTLILYGFSMGSAAALRAVAVEGVRPDAIIIEATFDRLLSTAARRFHSMGLPATPFAQLLLFWGGVQWGFDPFTHNPAEYAAAVRCPLLVLQGDADLRISADEARHIADAAGAHATLNIYPGVPHLPLVEARPDAWQRDVAGFLAAH
jgi:alpha-beta hydrolase superfamily lysophospholipase